MSCKQNRRRSPLVVRPETQDRPHADNFSLALHERLIEINVNLLCGAFIVHVQLLLMLSEKNSDHGLPPCRCCCGHIPYVNVYCVFMPPEASVFGLSVR